MIRHPLAVMVAVFSIAVASQAVARGGGGHGGGAGHGVGARGVGHVAGLSRGGFRGSATFGMRGARGFAFQGYGGRYAMGGFRNSGGSRNWNGAGRAGYGHAGQVRAGMMSEGNPTQTPVAAPAIYQIEPSGNVRNLRPGSDYRRPGIYPVNVSDGVQPNIYVIRVPSG